jgi:hypothetical protein
MQRNTRRCFGIWNSSLDRATVVMFNVVTVAGLPPGVTDTGEKLQEAAEGKPEHANVMGFVKPFDAAMDNLKAAD